MQRCTERIATLINVLATRLGAFLTKKSNSQPRPPMASMYAAVLKTDQAIRGPLALRLAVKALKYTM